MVTKYPQPSCIRELIADSQKSRTRNVDLHDDDPEMVKAMVQFCYRGDYQDIASTPVELDEPSAKKSVDIEKEQGFYEVADKYDVRPCVAQ
jgi:hypothetical protein